MPIELFANTATTSLSAAITTIDATTLTVVSSSPFPTAATGVSQFRIGVDAEIMIVTDVSGVVWTVTRGAEGSTAVTHLAAATVTHVLTAGAIANLDAVYGPTATGLNAAFVGTPSATTPAHQAGKTWRSSRYQDMRVSNAVGDRRKIITGTLGFENTVVQEPSVWVANGLYNMYYTGGSLLVYASCPLTADPTVATNWTKNPTQVLGNGVGYAGFLYHGNAYIEGSTIYYYYVDQATNATLRLATAPLSTPKALTDQGVVMTLPYTAVAFGNTSILKISGTYYMIFEMSIANWQLGIATCATPTGTFTATQSTMNTLWAKPNYTASGSWAVVEGTDVVIYYHSGPQVAGSVPTEIYRARIPLASFGTNAWVIDNNAQPILRRVAKEEADQVADPFVVTNPAGQSYIFWEGYDNDQAKASIFCQPLLAIDLLSDGSIWQTSSAPTDSGPGNTAPQKGLLTVMAVNQTSVTPNVWTTVLTQTFRPSGPSVNIRMTSLSSVESAPSTVKFRATGNATTKSFGSITFYSAAGQMSFSGATQFTGLTPDALYTFTIEVSSGTAWNCRAALYPDNEQLTMHIEDAMFPNHG